MQKLETKGPINPGKNVTLKKLAGLNDRQRITSSIKDIEYHITLNLDRIPKNIGWHAPNGRIDLRADDVPDILKWVHSKIGQANQNEHNYIIVNMLHWTPAWLAFHLGAYFYALYLDGAIDELRYYTQNEVQHNIFNPDGILGIRS